MSFVPLLVPNRKTAGSKQAATDEGCGSTGCVADDVALFCNHGVTLKKVTGEGLLVVLFGLLGLSFATLSFAFANGEVELAYAILGFDALLTTTAFLWRARDQRLTATLQNVVALTLVGVAGLSSLDRAWIGALAAGLTFAIGLLWVAAIEDPLYNLDEIVKFIVAAFSAMAFLLGISFLLTSPVTGTIFLVSGAGLAVFFFGGFLRRAVDNAFKLPLPTESRIDLPRERSAISWDHREEKAGLLGMFVMFTNRLITAVNGMMSAATTAVNVVVRRSFQVFQQIELLLHRMVVRARQILLAMLAAIQEWASQTWTLLHRHVMPSFIGLAAFSGTAVSILLASRWIRRYVVANDGFAMVGWAHLALLGVLLAGAILCLAIACASYIVPFILSPQLEPSKAPEARDDNASDPEDNRMEPTYQKKTVPAPLPVPGLRSMLANVEATAPYAWFLLSLSVLGAVVGLPALRLIPLGRAFSSAGPYHFGPATTLVMLGLAIVLIIALRSPAKQEQKRKDQPIAGLGWIRRLADLTERAELSKLYLPASALALLAAGIVLLPTIRFGDDSVSQVLGSTTPQGAYDMRLSNGASCRIGIAGTVGALSAQTDCTGKAETCYATWNPNASTVELACSGGSSIELRPSTGSTWKGNLQNAYGAVAIEGERR